MSAATLIRQAEKDGLRFALTPSRTIKLTGPKDAAERWAPCLREHKAEIVASLAAISGASAEQTDGENYDPDEAAAFWNGITERVDECDRLIHGLCDMRNDDPEHRAALLALRQRMAPDKLDSDIGYLRDQIAKTKGNL